MRSALELGLKGGLVCAAALALAACGSGGGSEAEANNAAAAEVPPGQAELAEDPNLANAAAAAEAADMELYGGNAAAGEVGNSGVEVPTNTPADTPSPAGPATTR